MSSDTRNPYGLDVVDASAECFCDAYYLFDAIHVTACRKHGVTSAVWNGWEDNSQVVLTDVQLNIIAKLPQEAYE